MKVPCLILTAIFFSCVSTFALAQSNSIRRPRGVYAVVNVEDGIAQQQKANPSITPAELDAYFDSLYQDLLDDPAISGLTLQVHWDTLNPNAPPAADAYSWSYVDDAFGQASAWNVQNPTQAPKTVQLIVTPGFQTPQWVLAQIPSCDGLFQTPVQTPPSTCGTATFTGYQEGGDSTMLPLPWNPLYKSSWSTFLTALAQRYGSNPAFVSIAVAGPTAASAEMLLPNNNNANNPQTQFGAGITPNNMWLQLLAFHYQGMAPYQNSDQGFIDEWNAAIDLYGEIFSGITLVATTGNGLPNFAGAPFTVPSAFTAYCNSPDMDCAAETTILSHFVESTVGGTNAKSTQTSGMEASRVLTNRNLGVQAVKLLSQSTAQYSAPSAQILGGAQFNTSFANFTLQEGCTSAFPPDASDMPAGCSIPSTCTVQECLPVTCIPQACLAPGVTQADLASYKQFSDVPSKDLISPEQAEYNVLNGYFDATPVAPSFGGTPGAAPLNYLQVYDQDIQYAEDNVDSPAQVVEGGGASVSTSAQGLLNMALETLREIAEPPMVIESYDAHDDLYFITASPAEQAVIDSGADNVGPSAWSRTGESFNAYATGGAGNDVCRFYDPSIPPVGIHFYTALPAECANVRATLPAWQFESGDVFNIPLPVNGACASGFNPVIRYFDQRVAESWRFTTDTTVNAAMLARGWANEGVQMCAPQ